MSSCVMPVPPMTPRAVKRPRTLSEDAMSLERILKAQKRSTFDSPCPLTNATNDPEHAAQNDKSWPVIRTSNSIKYALAFLQDSRFHALCLLGQNQWERAVSVLDKVERANDIVVKQRRKSVLRDANARAYPSPDTPDNRPRKITFNEDVTVFEADDLDRSPIQFPTFTREEMFVLRASRAIPTENYSEFWN
ncbi:hypothetical protein Poli38472_006457 [Pythium oligandrum]|uniref:Uncharacterized protein n=1 Tax=Pythium oligandrum TaxID=41045 RepID=A0A8K1FEB4_PYTOL|nr:hypothetical protein Poli38472_006457 [Pythium oligandrum]|eukprot:TMW56447.1 hypothetical protein Poli38472_006457 [Pythium oligandrum]